MAFQCARNGALKFLLLTTVIIRLENRNEILGGLENRCRKEFLDDRNVIQE